MKIFVFIVIKQCLQILCLSSDIMYNYNNYVVKPINGYIVALIGLSIKNGLRIILFLVLVRLAFTLTERRGQDNSLHIPKLFLGWGCLMNG